MYERLTKCLAAGSVVALFPLLKDWPIPELEGLLDDLNDFAESEHGRIDEKWKAIALHPQFFFNAALAKQIDAARESAHLNTVAVCSEIASVAQHYIGQASASTGRDPQQAPPEATEI